MPALEQIEERNRRVEADKAWETSKTRRTLYRYNYIYYSCTIHVENWR